MNTQTQIQNQPQQPQINSQIDRRAIIAIARAIEKKRSFVVWYGDIYDELRKLVDDDDEFHNLENRLYEDIVERRIKNVYRFWGTCDDSECDIIIVSPRELGDDELKIVKELAQLYNFKRYEGDEEEREELTLTIHNLIKKWNSGCLKISGPAEAVYVLAKSYGLEIEEEEHLDRWHAGSIYYRIQGLDTRVVKNLWYCNDCVDFSTGNNFIEKCKTWRFEDDED
jgi:hypothetical protein